MMASLLYVTPTALEQWVYKLRVSESDASVSFHIILWNVHYLYQMINKITKKLQKSVK